MKQTRINQPYPIRVTIFDPIQKEILFSTLKKKIKEKSIEINRILVRTKFEKKKKFYPQSCHISPFVEMIKESFFLHPFLLPFRISYNENGELTNFGIISAKEGEGVEREVAEEFQTTINSRRASGWPKYAYIEA